MKTEWKIPTSKRLWKQMKRGFWSMSRKVAKIWSHFSAGVPCFDKCKSSAAEALTVSNKIFVTFWLNPYFCGIEVLDRLVIGSSPCILPQASNALCILQYLWSTCERHRCVCCIGLLWANVHMCWWCLDSQTTEMCKALTSFMLPPSTNAWSAESFHDSSRIEFGAHAFSHVQ